MFIFFFTTPITMILQLHLDYYNMTTIATCTTHNYCFKVIHFFSCVLSFFRELLYRLLFSIKSFMAFFLIPGGPTMSSRVLTFAAIFFLLLVFFPDIIGFSRGGAVVGRMSTCFGDAVAGSLSLVLPLGNVGGGAGVVTLLVLSSFFGDCDFSLTGLSDADAAWLNSERYRSFGITTCS